MSGATALPNYVAEHGGSAQRVLYEAGVVADELRDADGWLSLDRTAALYQAAAHELADPYFGLSFGRTVPLRAYGLLSYIVLNAADVATALDNLGRYSSRLAVTGATVEVHREGETARLLFALPRADPNISRQYVEAVLAVLCVMITALAGEQWRPGEIYVEHSPAGSAREATRVLGAKIRYGAGRNEIAFDASYLDRAVAGADRSLLPVIERHVNDVVGKADEDPLIARLRNEVAQVVCDGKPDIRSIARRLALSTRTLQRNLQSKGVRFKSIVNETRTGLAKEYLAQSGPSVTEIAFLLGYGELSTFDRAFKRETGLSPTAWRKSLRTGHKRKRDGYLFLETAK